MMKSSNSATTLINVLLLVVALLANAQSFSLASPKSVVGLTRLHPATSPLFSTRKDDDLPLEEFDEYSGDVDWDAEWKKVVAKQGQPSERPGKDFYKSEAEIATIRAANRATAEVKKAQSKLPSPPKMEMSSLTGDWRFWIGILALISVGTAVLSAGPSVAPITGGDSYYV